MSNTPERPGGKYTNSVAILASVFVALILFVTVGALAPALLA